MILATRFTFIDERSRKTCIFTQNRLNHLLCFSDSPLYHDKFNTDHATKIWNKQKFTSFETWSTITTTLKFSGLNTSPVLRNGFNKWEMGWFLLVIKTTCKLPVTVYKTIVSVMFQRFWLLLRWQKGRKEAWFRLLLVRIYEKNVCRIEIFKFNFKPTLFKEVTRGNKWRTPKAEKYIRQLDFIQNYF